MSKRPFAAGLTIALAITSGLVLSQLFKHPAPRGAENTALEWLAEPRPIADFTLTSREGEVTADAMRGHWQLLVLGFTQCPDLCPTTLAELSRLLALSGDLQLRAFFVSVDPDHDSPAKLAAYAAFFDDRITAITGDRQQLRELANSMGMNFRHSGAGTSLKISHSPTIALIGPDGYLRGRLRPGFDVYKAALELSTRIRTAS